jgi:hypothetical protein
VTRHAPEPGNPSGDQRHAVERARITGLVLAWLNRGER